MNQNIHDPYTMELDEAYYKKLVNADFFEQDGMIFVKNPVKDFDENLKQFSKNIKNKTKIEMYMNHIVMEFISTFYEKQKRFAENIIKSWEKTLKRKFPKKKIVIELVDEDGGYVIYLYTKRDEEKSIRSSDKISIRELS